MMNERALTIFLLGLVSLVSLAGGIYLMANNHSEDGKLLVGATTTVIALIVPSPLSKNFVPPDPALDDNDNDGKGN